MRGEKREEQLKMKKREDDEGSQKIVAIHVLVSGKVQGVYYRKTSVMKANALQVSGWVRNLADKSKVEMICVGRRDKIRAFVKWMKISGEDAARDVGFKHVKTRNRRVDKVQVTRKSVEELGIALGSKFVRRKTPSSTK